MGVELLYNSVHRKFKKLQTRCGRESEHPVEGALRPPINQFWRQDQLETRCGRENQHPEKLGPRPSGPQLGNLGDREGNADGHKSGGGQCVAVLFGLQLPLTHSLFK